MIDRVHCSQQTCPDACALVCHGYEAVFTHVVRRQPGLMTDAQKHHRQEDVKGVSTAAQQSSAWDKSILNTTCYHVLTRRPGRSFPECG